MYFLYKVYKEDQQYVLKHNFQNFYFHLQHNIINCIKSYPIMFPLLLLYYFFIKQFIVLIELSFD